MEKSIGIGIGKRKCVTCVMDSDGTILITCADESYSHAQMKFPAAGRPLRYFNRSSLNLAVLRYLARLFLMPSRVPRYPHTRVSSFDLRHAYSTAFMRRTPTGNLRRTTMAWCLAR